ncbi:MAG: hypothetical protein JWM12_3140 [Ilumatobacteraceae bacterium]|nr:hypothetical protein [Ilumatobacteraceae bacterium]
MVVSIVIGRVLLARDVSTRAELATRNRSAAAAYAVAGVLAVGLTWCTWQRMTLVDAGIDTIGPADSHA